MGYLSNFIVYTLAMVGLVVIALLVFKTSTSVGKNSSSKFLNLLCFLNNNGKKNAIGISATKLPNKLSKTFLVEYKLLKALI